MLVIGTRHLQWRRSRLHKQFPFGNLNEASITNDDSLLWTFTQCGVLQKGDKPNQLTVERLTSARLFFPEECHDPMSPMCWSKHQIHLKTNVTTKSCTCFLNAPGTTYLESSSPSKTFPFWHDHSKAWRNKHIQKIGGLVVREVVQPCTHTDWNFIIELTACL